MRDIVRARYLKQSRNFADSRRVPPKKQKPEPDYAHVRRHVLAVDAAERRRREGKRPLAWDNVILAYSGKKLNLKPPRPRFRALLHTKCSIRYVWDRKIVIS